MNNNRWMNISTFCRIYKLNPRTARQYCEQDKIKAEKMGPSNEWHIDTWQWNELLKIHNIDPNEPAVRLIPKFENYKEYLGKTYGSLTIDDIFPHETITEVLYAKCTCKCGGKRTAQLHKIIDGECISCGCEDFFINKMIEDYSTGAKKRDLEFCLTKEQFIAIVSSNCYYCGSPPSERKKTRKGNTFKMNVNGIDRKDNNLSYTTGNVVACCWNCNRAKGNLSEQEFYNWINVIYKYRKLLKSDV